MAYELFFDGFETYANTAAMLKAGYTGASALNSTAGRRGGVCIVKDSNRLNLVLPINPAATHMVVGAAIKCVNNTVISLRNGTTDHAVLTLTANAAATVSVGGAAAGSSSTLFPYNTYMFVEFGVSIGGAGIGTYEVRINGNNAGWFPATVADTQNGATTNINALMIQGSLFNDAFLDDLYVTYGDELVWLGDSRVDRLLFTGNTATQDWAPSSGNAWERLNAGDGYVESDVDEATSFFELADLSYNPLAIHGVKVGGLIKKSDAGYREACLLTNSDGTITETSPLPLSTDTLSIVTTLKTDPATGLAWDLPGVQALQPGLRVKV